MNCRIDRVISGDGSALLWISGRLGGRHVDTLRDLLQRETNLMAVDLTDVLLVDRDAVILLASSETHGTELRHCPTYIRQWVDREKGRLGPDA